MRVVLPELDQLPSPNCSSRYSAPLRGVVVHRWGGGSYRGVVALLRNPESQVSAHLVYAGETGPDHGKCAQLVHIKDKAWHCAFYNRITIGLECADAIWAPDPHHDFGVSDPDGFRRAARIVAWLCHHYRIPPRWTHNPSERTGVARHYDLGALGGGHTDPTTDKDVWQSFIRLVRVETRRGGFRPHWTL